MTIFGWTPGGRWGGGRPVGRFSGVIAHQRPVQASFPTVLVAVFRLQHASPPSDHRNIHQRTARHPHHAKPWYSSRHGGASGAVDDRPAAASATHGCRRSDGLRFCGAAGRRPFSRRDAGVPLRRCRRRARRRRGKACSAARFRGLDRGRSWLPGVNAGPTDLPPPSASDKESAVSDERQARENVFVRQFREVGQNLGFGHPGREIREHVVHRDSHPTDARLSSPLPWFDGDDVLVVHRYKV